MSRFTKLMGSKYPIMQAPMAGVSTPHFVSAACNAGIIGSHGCAMLSPDTIKSHIAEIRRNIVNEAFCINSFILPTPPTHNNQLQTDLKPIQNILDKYYNELNIKQPFYYEQYGESFLDQFQTILEEMPPIFSFTFGTLNKEQVLLLKRKDIMVIGSATNVEEAQHLYDIGCDCIVAQGKEAGGHRATFIGHCDDSMFDLESLVLLIMDKIDDKIPVIAAGGIMNAKDVNTFNNINGGSGVCLGTVYLNTKECEIPQCYKSILREQTYDTTEITDKFSGRAARGVANRFMNEMKDIQVPPYPIMNKLTGMMRQEAKLQNVTDLMSLWAGQGVSELKQYEENISIKELTEKMMMDG